MFGVALVLFVRMLFFGFPGGQGVDVSIAGIPEKVVQVVLTGELVVIMLNNKVYMWKRMMACLDRCIF